MARSIESFVQYSAGMSSSRHDCRHAVPTQGRPKSPDDSPGQKVGPTPLQRRLAKPGRVLIICSAGQTRGDPLLAEHQSPAAGLISRSEGFSGKSSRGITSSPFNAKAQGTKAQRETMIGGHLCCLFASLRFCTWRLKVGPRSLEHPPDFPRVLSPLALP